MYLYILEEKEWSQSGAENLPRSQILPVLKQRGKRQVQSCINMAVQQVYIKRKKDPPRDIRQTVEGEFKMRR